MCSFNKFPECVGGKPHEWHQPEQNSRGVCLVDEEKWDKRVFFSCRNCDTQIYIDGLLPERSSLRLEGESWES